MSSAWEIGRFPSKCGVGYSSGVMLRLLCLFTGAATAIPVVWALGWAVWGAAVSITEYVSLLGSLILVASAAVSSSKRTFAARLALIGTVAVWSFYMPAIVGFASTRRERSGTRPRCPPVDSLNFAARHSAASADPYHPEYEAVCEGRSAN